LSPVQPHNITRQDLGPEGVEAQKECPNSWKDKTARDVLDNTNDFEEYHRIRAMTSAEYNQYLQERNLSRPK